MRHRLRQELEARILDKLRQQGLDEVELLSIEAEMQALDMDALSWMLEKIEERHGEHKWLN